MSSEVHSEGLAQDEVLWLVSVSHRTCCKRCREAIETS
jgi:hypothetical protein